MKATAASMKSLLGRKPVQEATFEYFNALPPELRIEIWKLALPRGRYVRIHTKRWLEKRRELSITMDPIALLGVCRESRELALEYFPPKLSIGRSGRPLNLDYSNDIFYFDGLEATQQFWALSPLCTQQEWVEFETNVQRVALRVCLHCTVLRDFFLRLKNLKHLSISIECPTLHGSRSGLANVMDFRFHFYNAFLSWWLLNNEGGVDNLPVMYLMGWGKMAKVYKSRKNFLLEEN